MQYKIKQIFYLVLVTLLILLPLSLRVPLISHPVFASTTPSIEQEINMIDNTGINLGGTSNSVLIDTNNYSGSNVSYYFEVVGNVTSGTGTVTLTYNAGTGAIPCTGCGESTISVTVGTTLQRYRSAAFTPTGAQDASITSSSGTGRTFNAARIVVVQSDSTSINKTVTQIEVGDNDSTTSTTDVPVNSRKYWHYDASKYDGTVTVYFEANINNATSGQTVTASLYPAGTSCSGQVSGSQVTSDTSTTVNRVRTGDISSNLTSGTDYMVCYHASANTAKIHIAHLIIQQTSTLGLTKMEIQRLSVSTALTNNTSTYVSQNMMNQFNPASWSGGTFQYYYEATFKTGNVSNAAFTQLYNTSDAAAIASSEVTTNSNTVVRQRSGTLTMPTAAKELDTQIKNASTNVSTVNGSWLIVDVSGLFTGGQGPSSTDYRLLDFGFGAGGTATISSQSYGINGILGEVGGASANSNTYQLYPGLIVTEVSFVPPAPTVTNPSSYYNQLQIVINTGNNPSDTKFAVAISPNGFTSTTKYVQADGTLGSSAVWQTNSLWGPSGFNVVGLSNGTTYTVKDSAKEGNYQQSAYSATASATTLTPTFSFSLTPNSVAIGQLTAGNVITAPSNVTVTMTTNAVGGGDVYVYDTNAGLLSSSVGHTIAAQSGNLGSVIVAEGYGLQGGATSASSGGPMEVLAPYIGTGSTVGTIDTTKRVIFDSSLAPVTTGTGVFSIKAKASNVTKAAPDYADTITVITSATF